MRLTAGENLGALTALSARADALAGDLATSVSSQSGGTQEAYLVAMRGMLASSGARLTPATLAKIGAALQGLLQGSGRPAAPPFVCSHAPGVRERHVQTPTSMARPIA